MAAKKKKTKVVRKVGAKRKCGRVVGVIVDGQGHAVRPFKKGHLTYMTANGSVVQTARAKPGQKKGTCAVRKGRKKGRRKAK